MTFDPPEGETIHILCFRSGGAAIQAGSDWFWCGSKAKKGWHQGDFDAHAQYFPTVERAVMFARGAGWVGE
jgi:hypothetical protein